MLASISVSYWLFYRLQYFARKCQAYHASLQAAVKSKGTAVEVNDEQVRLGREGRGRGRRVKRGGGGGGETNGV